jgi:hypothetical protein
MQGQRDKLKDLSEIDLLKQRIIVLETENAEIPELKKKLLKLRLKTRGWDRLLKRILGLMQSLRAELRSWRKVEQILLLRTPNLKLK